MAATGWDVFVIEAVFALKILGYIAVFGGGVYVGWQLNKMLSTIPLSKSNPSVITIKSGGSPAELGGLTKNLVNGDVFVVTS